MNLPNAVNSQYYQPDQIVSSDLSILSTHFNENGKNTVESLLQLDKPEKFSSSAHDDRNHRMRQNDLFHLGYVKCFDTNSIDYRVNDLNFSYENLIETNTVSDQSCTQPIAYHSNYEDGNQLPNETGKFLFLEF